MEIFVKIIWRVNNYQIEILVGNIIKTVKKICINNRIINK